jgi:hypothetical protein
MNEWYFPIRLIDTTDPVTQPSLVCWQHCSNDGHEKFCDDNGIEIVPPAKHEALHLSYPPDPHHLPGVRLDPANPYTPPPMSEFIAQAKPVQDAYAALQAGQPGAQARFDAAKATYDKWNAANVARYKESGQAEIDAARDTVSRLAAANVKRD